MERCVCYTSTERTALFISWFSSSVCWARNDHGHANATNRRISQITRDKCNIAVLFVYNNLYIPITLVYTHITLPTQYKAILLLDLFLGLSAPIFLRGSKKSEAKNLLLDNDVSGGRFRRMESNINACAGRSYAEMSEKEFRKLVKKITS